MKIHIELTADQQAALAQHVVFHVTEPQWGKGPFSSPLAEAVREKVAEIAAAAADEFLRQHPEVREQVGRTIEGAVTHAVASDDRLGGIIKTAVTKGLAKAIYDDGDDDY
jgi:hypothetical protein